MQGGSKPCTSTSDMHPPSRTRNADALVRVYHDESTTTRVPQQACERERDVCTLHEAHAPCRWPTIPLCVPQDPTACGYIHVTQQIELPRSASTPTRSEQCLVNVYLRAVALPSTQLVTPNPSEVFEVAVASISNPILFLDDQVAISRNQPN